MEMTEDERNGRDFREAETKGDKILERKVSH